MRIRGNLFSFGDVDFEVFLGYLYGEFWLVVKEKVWN